MPRQINRPSRAAPRSSVKRCEEHSACSQDKPNIAEFHCENCRSNQCKDCYQELHPPSSNHEYRILEVADPKLVCVSKNCHNFADFHCKHCQPLSGGAQYCMRCDKRIHSSGLNYSHSRIPFTQYQQEKLRQQKITKENEIINSQLCNPQESPSVQALCDQDQFFSILPSDSNGYLMRSGEKESRDRLKDINIRQPAQYEISCEDNFFSIKEENSTTSTHKMRGGNLSETRERLPKFDRQSSNDGSMMKTLGMESRKITPDLQNRSVRLIDEDENLLIGSTADFLNALGLKETNPVKVVSIFGNTGVGKSHTLNSVFFRGEEVFKTSPSQDSCTYGVWAAYDHRFECLVVDTEGLLGKTTNEPRRRRLLLKVLGISDVVIYRTNAARLETDMFHFLHDASKAFEDYFAPEFKAMIHSNSMPVTNMSPYVIIFQETRHTKPLSSDSQNALKVLHKMAGEMNLSLNAFPGIRYVGIQTSNREETDFKPLKVVLKQSLDNDGQCERISRSGRVVYEVLSNLNEKYSGEIPAEEVVAFSSKYFSCRMKCKSCDQRCQLSLNHKESSHMSTGKCKYRADVGNRVFMCKQCLDNGVEQLVRWQTCTAEESGIMGMMMFLKRGHIIECPSHGVIYRSFEQWYNNPPPEAAATVIRIVHVWPGDIPLSADGCPGHVGQRIIDMGKSVTQVVSPSLQVASEWMSDQVAPEYWTPNAAAQNCHVCGEQLGEKLAKHHCRRCGKLVCDHCSPKQMVLAAWGARAVRVCNPCYERPLSSKEYEDEGKKSELTISGRGRSTCVVAPTEVSGNVDAASEEQVQNTARVVTETVGQAAGVFSSVFKQSASWMKDLARPSYWKPDSELVECSDCRVTFGPTENKTQQLKFGMEVTRHHCRRCGEGFCTFCSSNRLPVPSRGWEGPVRVCNQCSKLTPPL